MAFPRYCLAKKTNLKEVYLTFDDGPVEKETRWVMDILDEYKVKATFFCVGENAHRHPLLAQELVKRGHSLGNHTYNHLPAWKCSRSEYFDNIEKARQFIPSKLFRPPHGKLYPWYINNLKKQFSEVVMWDVLSKDYDVRLSPEKVIDNVLNHVRNGSVIVFHDSQKAWDRLNIALPICLDALIKQGYQFRLFEM